MENWLFSIGELVVIVIIVGFKVCVRWICLVYFFCGLVFRLIWIVVVEVIIVVFGILLWLVVKNCFMV